MLGWREAGVLGFSVALAGGLAYAVWNYAFFSRESDESRAGDDGASGRGKLSPDGEKLKKTEDGEDAELTVAVARVEPVCSAERAPKVSEQSMLVKPEGTQVLVLGLDGAGKSSLLYCLAIGSLDVDMVPTQGFNAVSINREDLHIEFLEIGGKAELRPYWPRYMSKALLLVFVADSSAPQLFPVAKAQLHELLHSNPRLPLMVLANKQDLPGACSITDLHDALELSKVGDRKLFLIGTCVKKGEPEVSSGVRDARELIIQLTSDRA
ncbi:ADP-ribosylation factor-like protein 9 isoform X1 [Phyllopteryx taeniolatus]|uniref:ADP-ribosylation factor-like protein 9 isoform X1 n=1 Tax=Phyllopteryx taeniolatus TaxID=161469 RepID=UPI002AD21390|nr:ADP-ribosylation factor-like protein 9 isoform X1 [Phyllopteryx taeniolatus]XP_061643360.1 ADP-ribosylation factor-like protein 9 isoform X1 [Phyllopteryx taeniolatus]XP_061643361.1 ADP-ribosylation factor-like protein 9 isoform X1 [Phyllopteryx taeniolatus]